MKIQLLNPPTHHYGGVHYLMNPPLGLPILAAVLNNAGHTAEVVDLEALRVSPQRLYNSFKGQQDRWPDVVGLTALTSSARGARESIAAIREAGYGGTIVVGGVHATIAPEEAHAWGADTVVTGECEGNIADIVTRGPAGIMQGQPLPIEQIPPPDWDHHTPGPTFYDGNFPKVGHPEAITMWSRGCPWHCIFCGNAVFGRQRTRYRPPEQVASELADLRRRGIRALFVYDDELVGGPMPDGWMADLADRIAPLGLAWKAQGRCSRKHVTRETLEDMKRAGCKVIMWGVESFSPNVLKAIRKGTSTDDIWHTLRLSKEAGIDNWLFTMIGNYQETEGDLAITARALRDAYAEGLVDYRQTTVVTALPHTELAEIQQREGWWTPPPEAGPQMNQIYTSTPWLTSEQIAYWMRAFADACPVSYMGRAA